LRKGREEGGEEGQKRTTVNLVKELATRQREGVNSFLEKGEKKNKRVKSTKGEKRGGGEMGKTNL